jgi:group I intron endonuclease
MRKSPRSKQQIKDDLICGVYIVLNAITHKCYTGSSKDIRGRWISHERLLMKGNHHSKKLQNSWNKHGKYVWFWQVIELCGEKELIEREDFYIDKHDSYHTGYNSIGRANKIEFTREIREKMGSASRAWQNSQDKLIAKEAKRLLELERRSKQRAIRRFLTEARQEERRLLKAAEPRKPRKPQSEEHKQKILEALRLRNSTGWQSDPAVRKNIAVGVRKRGWQPTDEFREAQSRAHKGRKQPNRTAEQRENYSKASKAAYERRKAEGISLSPSAETLEKRAKSMADFYASDSESARKMREDASSRLIRRSQAPAEKLTVRPEHETPCE